MIISGYSLTKGRWWGGNLGCAVGGNMSEYVHRGRSVAEQFSICCDMGHARKHLDLCGHHSVPFGDCLSALGGVSSYQELSVIR